MHAPTTAWRVLLSARERDRSHAIARALSAEGQASVVEVESPEEGIRHLDLGKYDAVIANHPMRSPDGLDLLETARLRHPAVRRILLTGEATLETVVHALQSAGVHAVLTEHLGMADVVRLVRSPPDMPTRAQEPDRTPS